jgi:hypothetical protein
LRFLQTSYDEFRGVLHRRNAYIAGMRSLIAASFRR